MAKDKDANDIGKEAREKGKVVRLHTSEEEDTIEMRTNKRVQEDKFLSRMNKDHAFIHSLGSKAMVMFDSYSIAQKRYIKDYCTPDTIVTRYANEQIASDDGPKGTTMSLGKWWIQHPERRDYNTVVFDPELQIGEVDVGNGVKVWNTWEGFGVQPAKGSWRLTRRHIWSILCNKDKEKFKYFIRWIAWAFQNPGKPAEVAVIFKGKKGAGKGCISTALADIFGRHGYCITNSEHLTGKHNAHLMETCLLFADEAYYPGDKDVEGVLKALITEPRMTVEPKFQNARLVKNCLHIIMSTNADWVVPATMDERRWFINVVDNKYSSDGQSSKAEQHAYFNALFAELQNGGKAAMLHDLLALKLDNWHPRHNVPRTEELIRQASMSLGRKEKHVLAMLEHGVFPGVLEKDEYLIDSKSLMEHLDKIDPRANITMRLTAEVLKRLGAAPKKTQLTRKWVFPKLSTMKLTWNKEYGKYDWLDYDEWDVESHGY